MKFLERFKEPSTHAGIAAAMQALSFFFPAYAGIFNVITGVFASSAVVLPEGVK